MRCCSRSTTWRASAVLACVLAAAFAAPAGATGDAAVRNAIESAVRRLVGEPLAIEVRDLRVTVVDGLEGRVFVTLPVEARAGVPIRVQVKALGADGRAVRFGEAHCIVDLRLPAMRTRRAVSRGETIAAADVEAVEVDAAGWPLRALPVDVDGARAIADVPAGQVLRRQMLVTAPLVRSGEPVTVTFRAGGFEVQARGLAMQAGRLGELIKVVNPDSGRRLSARVVGPATVEVDHGS